MFFFLFSSISNPEKYSKRWKEIWVRENISRYSFEKYQLTENDMINPIPDNETMTNDTVSVEFDDKKLSDYTEKNGISGSTQETDESMLPPIFTQWTLSKRVHTTPHHTTPHHHPSFGLPKLPTQIDTQNNHCQIKAQ